MAHSYIKLLGPCYKTGDRQLDKIVKQYSESYSFYQV